MTGTFLPDQINQLLQPINPRRVLLDGKKHSHVSQQDVLAHLIRVFGFGAFDIDVLQAECVFETERVNAEGVGSNRWDVCYRAMVRLTIRDPEGGEVCHYVNGSTHTAQNQTRGDGHDLAYKSAISLSVKRAAIALGDQFGLSLYNKGQMTALVKATLVGGPEVTGDMQEGVEQQVSLGNDEIDQEPEVTPATQNGTPVDPTSVIKDEIRETAKRLGKNLNEIAATWKSDYDESLKDSRDVDRLNALRSALLAEQVARAGLGATKVEEPKVEDQPAGATDA